MQKMKANPVANEDRLRVHREKKQKYWQRVKESIATATATNLVTEQNDDSAFSQAHTRSRSIQKITKTLPKTLENAKKSFQHCQTNSGCTLSQPSRRQVDQKTSRLEAKENGSKTF